MTLAGCGKPLRSPFDELRAGFDELRAGFDELRANGLGVESNAQCPFVLNLLRLRSGQALSKSAPPFFSSLLNQTTKDWHSRSVTLSAAKGLAVRFFAALRMTLLNGCVAKCTNVVHFDLGPTLRRFPESRKKCSSLLLKSPGPEPCLFATLAFFPPPMLK